MKRSLKAEQNQMTVAQMTTVDLMAYAFLRYRMEDLRSRGHRNLVIASVERFRESLEKVADEVIDVPMARSIHPWRDLCSLVQLVNVLRSRRVDVLHTHSSKAGMLGRIAGRLAGVPVVVHTIHELPQNATDRPIIKWIYRQLERAAARISDHTFTQSKVNYRQILAERITTPERLTLTRLGLETDKYINLKSLRREWGIGVEAEVIGTVMRMEKAKDHDTLFRAFALLAPRRPRATLVCVGRGHLEPQLRALAAELGIAHRIVFTGWVESQLDAIASFDVFALSSHCEGLGMVLLEALALKVPVVSTLVGGTADVIRDGETGLFVPPRSPVAMAAALERMLSEPAWARATADAGHADVVRRFNCEESNQLLYDTYTRLLAGKLK